MERPSCRRPVVALAELARKDAAAAARLKAEAEAADAGEELGEGEGLRRGSRAAGAGLVEPPLALPRLCTHPQAWDPLHLGLRYEAREGGGQARTDKQPANGTLPARERLALLLDAETKNMRMPGCRDDGRRYDSVRAGPHRPAMSGPGDGGDGDDASIIWVLYKARAAALSSPPSRACC